MADALSVIIPLAAMFLGMGIAVGLLLLGRHNVFGRARKSPFTSDFLRAPGQTLADQIEELKIDAVWDVTLAAMIPLMLISTLTTRAYISGSDFDPLIVVATIVIGLGVLVPLGIKVFRKGRRLRSLRLGYEGEVAVGQELNQLLAQGFRVYHDFPAGKFNVDHVVIGPTGIFAVETKARAKPNSGDGKADARVEFHGTELRFPGWKETAPIDQAVRQAEALSKWLASAVGEPVAVRPVVALPGWYVVTVKPGEVLVFNGKNYRSVFPKVLPPKRLDDKLIQQIAHQIEQKCRSVSPLAVRKSGKPAQA